MVTSPNLKKEIFDQFRLETISLVRELEKAAERMKESGISEFPEADLKEFAQKIDRVMGAAKSIEVICPGNSGLRMIGVMGQACKTVGYQAAALQRASLAPFYAEYCLLVLDVVSKLVISLGDEAASSKLVETHAPRLQTKLKWLMERAAPANEEEKKKVSELLRRL